MFPSGFKKRFNAANSRVGDHIENRYFFNRIGAGAAVDRGLHFFISPIKSRFAKSVSQFAVIDERHIVFENKNSHPNWDLPSLEKGTGR